MKGRKHEFAGNTSNGAEWASTTLGVGAGEKAIFSDDVTGARCDVSAFEDFIGRQRYRGQVIVHGHAASGEILR